MSPGQTPAQTIGPFFHDALLREDFSRLDPEGVAGSPLRIEGHVLDGAGETVPDAMVELWQADGEGRYQHPADGRCGDVPAPFIGFGRVGTGPDGTFRFDTIMPGSVAGSGGAPQAPHLSVVVFARGVLDKLVTRIYFAGNPSNDSDPVLQAVPGGRRQTLLATPDGDADGTPLFRFDIVLQGDAETVFFDA